MLHKIRNELRIMPKYMYVLAFLTLFGLGLGAYRLYAGLAVTTNLGKAYPWGLWISFDLALVSLSAGAYTLAALVYVFHFEDLHAASRPTVLAGFLGYSSVLVILFFDLGRWDHFYSVFTHPNFSSALLEVSWCIATYSLILIYEFSPVLVEKNKLKWLLPKIKKYTVPVVIAGVTLSTMHQSSLGTLYVIMSPRLHELWYSMLLPVFFLISSYASGISLVIAGSAISYWLLGQSLKEKTIAKLAWFVPWILSFYLVLKFGELMITDELHLLFWSGIYSWLFWAEVILAVIAIALFSFKKVRNDRVFAMVASFFALGAVVLNRFNVTWFAIRPVLGEKLYTPHWMEVGLVTGIMAGVVLVYLLVARYLPVYEDSMPVKNVHTPTSDFLQNEG